MANKIKILISSLTSIAVVAFSAYQEEINVVADNLTQMVVPALAIVGVVSAYFTDRGRGK
jgi:hypothetical protein